MQTILFFVGIVLPRFRSSFLSISVGFAWKSCPSNCKSWFVFFTHTVISDTFFFSKFHEYLSRLLKNVCFFSLRSSDSGIISYFCGDMVFSVCHYVRYHYLHHVKKFPFFLAYIFCLKCSRIFFFSASDIFKAAFCFQFQYISSEPKSFYSQCASKSFMFPLFGFVLMLCYFIFFYPSDLPAYFLLIYTLLSDSFYLYFT